MAIIWLISALVAFLVWMMPFGVNPGRLADSAALCGILGFLVTVADRLAAFVRPKAVRAMRPTSKARLTTAAEDLAAAVGDQWRAEALLRRIHDPAPLLACWTAADPELSDHWENIRQDAGSRRPIDIEGSLRKVVEVFNRIPSRRLVVLGRPGSGKSVFALLFTLDLLRQRSSGDRVPVIFPVQTWHPLRQSLNSWMTDRLAASYPALRAIEASGRTLASELIRARLVLPVLDGLDEISAELRPDALRALNLALGEDTPVVLTCRSADYADVVRQADVLTSAAVVNLLPLTLDELEAYLPLTSRRVNADREGRLTTKWEPVLAQLRGQPHDPASTRLLGVLSTPLMTSLARSIYSDTCADPARLLSDEFPSQEALEAHLLDAFVPAAFAPLPQDANQRSWDVQDADRWLAFLARHLDRLGTRDLEWWRLEESVPGPVRGLATALSAGMGIVLLAFVIAPVQDRMTFAEIGAGSVTGLGLGLALITEKLPSSGISLGMHGYLRAMGRRLRYTTMAALATAVIFGFVIAAGPVAPDLSNGRWPAWAIFIVGCLFGISGGIELGAAGITKQFTPAVNPFRRGRARHPQPTRRLRQMGFSTAHGLLNAVAIGAIFGITFGIAAGVVAFVRTGTVSTLPVGAGRTHILSTVGEYVDQGGLRYVRLNNGSGYIEPLHEVSFFIGFRGGRPDSIYNSRKACGELDAPGECRPYSGSGVRYYSDHVTMANGATITAIPDSLPANAEYWLGAGETSWQRFSHFVRLWLRAGVTDGAYSGIIGGLFLSFDIPVDVARAASPRSTWESDRGAALIRSIAVAGICGLIMFLVFVYPKIPATSHVSMSAASQRTTAAGTGALREMVAVLKILAISVLIGVLVASLNSWSRLQVARAWLACRGLLPWHLLSFLDEAHRSGILRQAGTVYQFRHFRFQEQLARQDESAGAQADDVAVG